MKRKFLAALPLGLLACCAAPPPPPPPAPPPAPPAPPPPVTGDWRDIPLSAGAWAYAADAQGSAAMFGQPGVEADFSLRCDLATRTVALSRPGATAAMMAFTTSSGDRGFPGRPIPSLTPRIGFALNAADPWLDLLAFSRGRFVATTPGLATLVLPAWPEVARVIEDCRK